MPRIDFPAHDLREMRRMYDEHGYDGLLEMTAIVIRDSAISEDSATRAALRHVAMDIDRVRRNA